jgi:hypothetical protein
MGVDLMGRLIPAITFYLWIVAGTAALAQTGAVGWNGTWVGGWDRGAGVQLVFAGDQLVAFYWRDDYKDVRHASAGRGDKRFAWDGGEATVKRAPDGNAVLAIREQGKPELSITLKRE